MVLKTEPVNELVWHLVLGFWPFWPIISGFTRPDQLSVLNRIGWTWRSNLVFKTLGIRLSLFTSHFMFIFGFSITICNLNNWKKKRVLVYCICRGRSRQKDSAGPDLSAHHDVTKSHMTAKTTKLEFQHIKVQSFIFILFNFCSLYFFSFSFSFKYYIKFLLIPLIS